MRWDLAIITSLARNELRMLLRDPRVLVTGLLLPLLAMPLLIFVSTWTFHKRQQKLEQGTCRYAIIGSQAAWARTVFERAGELARLHPGHSRSNPTETDRRDFKGEEISVNNGVVAVDSHEIDVLVTALTAAESDQELRRGTNPATQRASPSSHSTPDGPAVLGEDRLKKPVSTVQQAAETGAHQIRASDPHVMRLTYRADIEESNAGLRKMQSFLENVRVDLRAETLARFGLPMPSDALVIHEQDVASSVQVAGVAVGRGLTLILLVFILTGGAIAALDALAGEKERGTLETLLVSGANRSEIIAAKVGAIMIVGLTATLAQIGSGLAFARLQIISLPVDVFAALSPGKMAILSLAYLPLVALVAAVLLIVSGRARSYKEAQLKFFPVFVLFLAPALAPFFPTLELRSFVVTIPIANTALSAREILTGSFDWVFLIVAWLVSAGAALIAGRMAVTSLSEERLVVPALEETGELRSPAEFGRQVLVWFAAVWALLLIVSNYFQKADIRAQLFVNLGVFLLGGSLLMVWYYRLPVRTALSLRAPPCWVWLVVVAGVPGGMLTATGLFRLVSYVAPVPREFLEAFSEELFPKQMSPAGIVLWLAVLPAIVEELTFRGVLLYGLRSRMTQFALVLTVGAVFGLFHMAFFRFAPTFILGVILAFVVQCTRSIFPAMLWHGLNNALGVVSAKEGYLIGDLEWPYYGLGAIALSISIWIIWRNRCLATEIKTFAPYGSFVSNR